MRGVVERGDIVLSVQKVNEFGCFTFPSSQVWVGSVKMRVPTFDEWNLAKGKLLALTVLVVSWSYCVIIDRSVGITR